MNWGGYPIQSWWWWVPHPVQSWWRGYSIQSSHGGGTPSSHGVGWGGIPSSPVMVGEGTPSSHGGREYPIQSWWWGILHSIMVLGGGYPIQSWWWGVPHPIMMVGGTHPVMVVGGGYPIWSWWWVGHTSSSYGGGGYPIQSWWWGVPHPVMVVGGRYPIQLWWWGVPHPVMVGGTLGYLGTPLPHPDLGLSTMRIVPWAVTSHLSAVIFIPGVLINTNKYCTIAPTDLEQCHVIFIYQIHRLAVIWRVCKAPELYTYQWRFLFNSHL